MSANKWFSIVARTRAVSEIVIYDEIGGGGLPAAAFAEQLKALGDVKLLNVSINSPGGDVFDGLTIYNLLKRHQATVNVRVDGLAASAASLVAMAGDKIIMPENAMMMIHDPSGLVVGTSADMQKMIESLRRVSDSMVGIYAARSGQPRAKITQMMEEETWLSAHEALALGLADRVEQPAKIAAFFDIAKKYVKAPSQLAVEHKLEAIIAKHTVGDVQQAIVNRFDEGGSRDMWKRVVEQTNKTTRV